MSRSLSERGRDQHGFTLIEVLVSALLTLIISAGVATALISATDFTSHERNTSQANAVAQQDQERLKSMSDSQLTALHQTRTVTLNSTQFTVVSSASFLDANGNSSCTSKNEAYFKLSSNVTSVATVGNPAQTVTEETIITRPLGGSLVVPVQDQTSTALQGANVSVVGQNTNYSASATTDQNGCAAFAGLPTDSYTITASDAGYVDPNGLAAPTETATVNQTNVTSGGTMTLGPAGGMKVGFVTAGTGVIYDGRATPYASGHAAAPAGYDISYYGSGNGSNMATDACLVYPGTACTGTGSSPVVYTVPSASAFTSVSPGNLFPFYMGSTQQYTKNYQVWAGACEQEQPLQPPIVSGVPTNYATDFDGVSPGQSATTLPSAVDVAVFEPAIDVAVKSNGGSPVLPTHVTIEFDGMNSAGTATTCRDTWHLVQRVGTETVGGVTYAVYPAPFASQAAQGTATASNTGDKGTITVCADYNSHYEWSPAMQNVNFTAPTDRQELKRSGHGRRQGHWREEWDMHMTALLGKISARLRRQEGFTLVELLAAMAAGLVVVGGLVTVLSVTLQQTTNTFTRVDATEHARIALSNIEDELHSACLVDGVTPIEGGAQGSQDSDANDLVFVSQYGTAANPTPVEHKITYSPSKGTLTDYTYSVSGAGSDPTKWVFASTPTNASGKLLLNHVGQIQTPHVAPVFQYFAYEPYTDQNGDQAMMIMDGSATVPGTSSLPNPDPLATASGLSQTDAASTAEVIINLLVGAEGGNFENTNLTSASDPVTDSIVLRFTPPADATGSTSNFGPCS